MLEKLKAFYALFEQGKAVANPAAWKAHQITATMLGGLFIAIVQMLKVFGHEPPIDSDTATSIAGGIIAAVNVVLTVTTSKSVGLLSTDVPEGAVTVPEQVVSSVPEANVAVSAPEVVPVVSLTNMDSDTYERAMAWIDKHK